MNRARCKRGVKALLLVGSICVVGGACGNRERSAEGDTVNCAAKVTAREWQNARVAVDRQATPTDLQILADRLKHCGQLTGLPPQAVRELLGPPNGPSYVRSGFNWAYYLGRERAQPSIDSEWLAVGFAGSKVNRVAIYRD
jgi:hypothetical protein